MVKQKTLKEINQEIEWYETHLEATNQAILETVQQLEELARQKDEYTNILINIKESN